MAPNLQSQNAYLYTWNQSDINWYGAKSSSVLQFLVQGNGGGNPNATTPVGGNFFQAMHASNSAIKLAIYDDIWFLWINRAGSPSPGQTEWYSHLNGLGVEPVFLHQPGFTDSAHRLYLDSPTNNHPTPNPGNLTFQTELSKNYNNLLNLGIWLWNSTPDSVIYDNLVQPMDMIWIDDFTAQGPGGVFQASNEYSTATGLLNARNACALFLKSNAPAGKIIMGNGGGLGSFSFAPGGVVTNDTTWDTIINTAFGNFDGLAWEEVAGFGWRWDGAAEFQSRVHWTQDLANVGAGKYVQLISYETGGGTGTAWDSTPAVQKQRVNMAELLMLVKSGVNVSSQIYVAGLGSAPVTDGNFSTIYQPWFETDIGAPSAAPVVGVLPTGAASDGATQGYSWTRTFASGYAILTLRRNGQPFTNSFTFTLPNPGVGNSWKDIITGTLFGSGANVTLLNGDAQIFQLVVTAGNTVSTAPQTLANTLSGTNVVLTWVAPSSNGGSAITNYKIYRGPTAGSESLLTTVGNVLTFTDTTTASGQNYYYVVTAVNGVGESPRSNEINAIVGSVTVPQAPGAPTVLTSYSIYLSWIPPLNTGTASITSYNIYRGSAAGTETLYVSVPPKNQPLTTTYADTGVVPGQNYFYKVTAVSSAGESQPSGEISNAIPTATATGFVPPPQLYLAASLVAAPSRGRPAPLTVSLTTGYAGVSGVATYVINFGDGTAPVMGTDSKSADTILQSHAYANIGTYVASCVVTDTSGRPPAFAFLTITVTP